MLDLASAPVGLAVTRDINAAVSLCLAGSSTNFCFLLCCTMDRQESTVIFLFHYLPQLLQKVVEAFLPGT